ncbi:MAG: sugar phosphate nucleotidyltransferase [Oscillospiraceae bacterium]|nr:sugar phosphate nucleotidyltransferase [Oscillospiraceae bacterium]
MKAIIMAGGEGSRLRPLTCDLPKPMARLCGRPILEYILDLLSAHGVREAALTLQYLPRVIIEHFPDGRYGEIELQFVEETTPLGTAGSVKNACRPEDDDLLIISGDAMCDFDLTAFAAAHRQSGAAVSILGKRVADPREYGLIDADEAGRIAGFIEKPAFSQAVSDMANTGIYILSARALALIPPEAKFDFAKDLFPLLLRKGETLYCWEGTGYWCDIGDLDSYISCQRDMLYGKVQCKIPARELPGQSAFERMFSLSHPVYFGKNVTVEDDAIIEAGSVLDDGCVIGRGARISGGIVLQGGQVGRGARLTGSLVCAGASVKAGAMLFEGSTVGAGGVIGEGATLAPGVKVWNHKRVEDGARVIEHVKLSVGLHGLFDENGISGQIGVELTPEFSARVGAALGSKNPSGKIAVGCGPGRGAEVIKQALAAGIQSTGAQVMDFGPGFGAQFAFCASFCNFELGAFVRGDDRAAIQFYSGGMPATRALEREVQTLISRGEFVRASHDRFGELVEMSGVCSLYRSQLTRFAPGGLDRLAVRVKSKNQLAQAVLRKALEKMGCDIGGENPVLIELSTSGERLRIWDPAAGSIHHHTILAACAIGEMEHGQDVALPFDAPRMIDEQAKRLGRKVLRYLITPADESDQEARKLARSQMWSRDGLMQAVIFLNMALKRGGIKNLLDGLTSFEVSVRTLETTGNPAALLKGLSSERSDHIGEGVLVKEERGVLLIKPTKKGNALRILAEAVSTEAAQELCESAEDLLRRAGRDI